MRRTNEGDIAWITPFGHRYSKSQIEKNGSFFAKDVAGFLDVLHSRCQFREANGAYEAILDFWLKELSKNEYRCTLL